MIEAGLAARTIISYHGAFYTMMEDAYKRKMIAVDHYDHFDGHSRSA